MKTMARAQDKEEIVRRLRTIRADSGRQAALLELAGNLLDPRPLCGARNLRRPIQQLLHHERTSSHRSTSLSGSVGSSTNCRIINVLDFQRIR